MIQNSFLESWQSIANRIGIKAWRRGRGECPFCESRTGFSVHDERGFHCFACGVHGDKICFIQRLNSCGFKEAIQFFGLEPGQPALPDPAIVRRRKARAGLQAWAKKIGKELRYEFYLREKIITKALQRLRGNPDDHFGWSWLGWALLGHCALEYQLDQLEGNDEEKLNSYRQWRTAA